MRPAVENHCFYLVVKKLSSFKVGDFLRLFYNAMNWTGNTTAHKNEEDSSKQRVVFSIDLKLIPSSKYVR